MNTKQAITINILTDKSSWMIPYSQALMSILKNKGFNVNLVYSKKFLKKSDISFFLSCFEFVDKEYLALSKHNIVIHESKLPLGKGWSPMTWQILEGKHKIPLTLFEASEQLDSGDIYLQDEIVLKGTELLDEWHELLGKKTIEMCLTFIERYPDVILQKQQQQGEESFYERRTPCDSQLDIDKTLREQFNLLRVVDNERYPAFFHINNKTYILKIYEK